jgi:bifunctional non-homologous end joining protein LigD
MADPVERATTAEVSLRSYSSKRNFKKTAEPAPNLDADASSRLYVVQKHAAHRAGLHWDFRLEHGGVLWSWAVPKGPSLDPAERRVAVHVEDHPITYADFQGEIPAGEYGGGSVEIWDRGTWEPLDDPETGMRKGSIRFVLHGQRLSGRFTLARLKRHDPRKQEAWFLIKGHDEHARDGIGTLELEQETPARKGRGRKTSAKPTSAARAEKAAQTPQAPPARDNRLPTVVVARAPRKAVTSVGDVELTHPDRQLWPGISKRDLAAYWLAVAPMALPGLIKRPLSIVRCPDGVEGKQKFYQKSGHGYMPTQIREGHGGGQPYLAIDDAQGLIALTQISAIELHPWGAAETDPLRPDRIVFDLDPGEGVPFADVVTAAVEVRERLKKLKLTSFCRTTGGKGLHVVVPLRPEAAWEPVKLFCRAFAETMAQDAPDRYLAHLKIADRTGRILVDWLRNGLGATAVSSYCPRARPGAGVATPLTWSEVKPQLDPGAFTVRTVPKRLEKQKRDPWLDWVKVDQGLPNLKAERISVAKTPAAHAKPPPGGARIVVAQKPKPLLKNR